MNTGYTTQPRTHDKQRLDNGISIRRPRKKSALRMIRNCERVLRNYARLDTCCFYVQRDMSRTQTCLKFTTEQRRRRHWWTRCVVGNVNINAPHGQSAASNATEICKVCLLLVLINNNYQFQLSAGCGSKELNYNSVKVICSA